MCTCQDTTALIAREVFLSSLQTLRSFDAALGGNNYPGIGRTSEQAIMARVAHHMASVLDCEESDDRSHLRVDVEYNRHEDAIKEPPPELNADWMVVDLCVHIRRKQDKNLLVVEAKPPPRSTREEQRIEDDRLKLRWATKPDGPFHYALGALLLLDGTVHWFCEGEETGKTTEFEAIIHE